MTSAPTPTVPTSATAVPSMVAPTSTTTSTAVPSPSPAGPEWTDVTSALGSGVAAFAALATLAVAIIAAIYAKRQVDGARAQLEEARTQRREQAQPYVVVYADVKAAHPHFVDVVVKNFGLTGAHNLTISCSPPLQRSGEGEYEDVALPALPFLAPGQEWRTFWDSSIERKDSALPDRYDLVASYRDSNQNELVTPSVLDWSAFSGRMWLTEKTIHDAAKSLDSISKTMKKWNNSIHGGLAVYSRDGDAKDERDREERAKWRREQQQSRGQEADQGSEEQS